VHASRAFVVSLVLRLGKRRRDVVSMPSQFKLLLGSDEHIVQFHCQIILVAANQRTYVFQQLGVEIAAGED
jgi:hypothetical protein